MCQLLVDMPHRRAVRKKNRNHGARRGESSSNDDQMQKHVRNPVCMSEEAQHGFEERDQIRQHAPHDTDTGENRLILEPLSGKIIWQAWVFLPIRL